MANTTPVFNNDHASRRPPGGARRSIAVIAGLLAVLAIAGCGDLDIEGAYGITGATADASFDIYVIDPGDLSVRNLTDHLSANILPAWSPDGRRIAVLSLRSGGGKWGRYVMDADGSDVAELIPDVARMPHSPPRPRWSADGRYLHLGGARPYALGQAPGQPGQTLWVVGAGMPSTAVEEFPGDTFPSLSPDGTRVAYVSEARGSGRWRITVADVGGSGSVELISGLEGPIPRSLLWSSAGSYLAVGSQETLWVFAADGASTTQVDTRWTGVWSPDRHRLVFGASDPEDGQETGLYVMGAGGSDRLRVAVGAGFGRLTWSPDGRQLAFFSSI